MNRQKEQPEVFCKNDTLENFAKFTGKHLYWSLSFVKPSILARNFLK